MRSGVFVAVVLASGALAGLVHGVANIVLVEPYLDEAIAMENAGRSAEFLAEYDSFRAWQKGGQVLAGVILGTSVGALFGIVYGLSRDSLPGGHDVRRALVLGAAMWFVISLVPFLKYPAEPPGAGGGDVALRGALFLAFTAISGMGAVGFYRLSKRLKGTGKILAAAGYGALVAAAWVLMPAGPDGTGAPEHLAAGFRAASAAGVAIYWASASLILGILWHRLRPDLPGRG